jgi:hypothetical protein
MKELNDENLQTMIEENGNLEQTTDVQLYKSIFLELAKQPKLKVDDLSSSVIEILIYREEWKNFLKSIIIISTIIIMSGLALIIVIGNVEYQFSQQIIIYLDSYKWTLLFIVLIIFLTEAVDKKFVMSSSKKIAPISQPGRS